MMWGPSDDDDYAIVAGLLVTAFIFFAFAFALGAWLF